MNGSWQRGDVDSSVPALAGECRSDGLLPADQVGMTVHVHDVVEIPGPAPLGECPQLLGEQFGNRVAQHIVRYSKPHVIEKKYNPRAAS
jgi:hypothetical protein